MPLQPAVGRALYKSLITAARALDHELSRCHSLKLREHDSLRAAASAHLPRDLRALLDSRPSTPPSSSQTAPSQSRQPKSPVSSPTFQSARSKRALKPHNDPVVVAHAPAADGAGVAARAAPSAAAAPKRRNGKVVYKSNSPDGAGGAGADDLSHYVGTAARNVSRAALADSPGGSSQSLDAAVGFAALRHLNARVDALRHLVYTTTSDAERFGIRVEVESQYQGADRNRYFFRYQVRIINASSTTIKLLSRAWTIRDLDGRVTVVEGPGVVGAFPTLAPQDIYEYSSAVPLHTPVGTQSGHYMFVTLAEEEESERHELASRMLQVPIAPFSHRTPSMDGRQLENNVGASQSSVTQSGKSGRRKKRNEDNRRR